MKHKLPCASLAVLALLLAWAASGAAQTDLQQRMGSASAPAQSHSREDAASTRSAGMAVVPADFAQLKLAPGFLLGLNVLDDTDFEGVFRIDEQGEIALPVLGAVHVAGETVSEARVQIGKILVEKGILKDPQVELSIQEYTTPEVTILGEVASPGKYPLFVPRKLVDVLALAGGTSIAAGNEIQITRGGAAGETLSVHYAHGTSAKSVEDVLVNPGDTVQVKRAGIVYVLGAVTRPGGYVMQEQGTLTVLQAISLANGTTIAASTGTIYLLRRNEDGSVVDMALPFKQITKGKRADIQLRATDVLYVPTSKVKSILTYSQGLLTAAASASIYSAAVY